MDEVISREVVANTYLSGTGIEVGALHNPLRVPDSAKGLYVDKLLVEGLRKHYPELNDVELVNVDIMADGERREMIGDETQDFVIANRKCRSSYGDGLLHSLPCLYDGYDSGILLKGKRCFAFSV